MPKSALPEHINDPEEIERAFPDDSQYGNGLFGRFYKWIHKETKTWFAFSYRCTEWWAKVKKHPTILLCVGGSGPWRFESNFGDQLSGGKIPMFFRSRHVYLSRVQYYKRWHLAIQLVIWDKIPLMLPMISFHWYPRASDVPTSDVPRPNLKGRVWFAYWNHFDADLVYWMFKSLYFGKSWK